MSATRGPENIDMQQQDLGLNLSTRRTRKMELLELMNSVVPWSDLVAQLTAVAPPKATGRPSFGHKTMLRLHLLQQLFGLSDFAMEEALFETPLYPDFAGLDANARLPDQVGILRFRHLLEKHNLAKQFFETVNAMLKARGLMLHSGTVIDATIIAAPSSTKNSNGKRYPEMHPTKKGNQWHHGTKSHIGSDAESGLLHSMVGTAANVNDVTQAHALVHGNETDVYADAGYQGVGKREETQDMEVNWHVAMRPGKRRALDKTNPLDAITDQIEMLKASIRAKVEHPFRVIKRQFGYTKVCYRGLAKNTAQLFTLFMLSNLWMVRKKLVTGLPA